MRAFWPAMVLVGVGLAGCAETQALRERVALQEQELTRLRQEKADFEKAYYDSQNRRTEEAESLNRRIQLLERELEAARNVRTQREKDLEEQLRKLSLESDAQRAETDEQRRRLAQEAERFNAALAQADSTRQTLANQFDELQKSAAADRARLELLEADLRARDQRIAELTTATQTAEVARLDLAAQLDETRAQLEAGRELLRKMEADRSLGAETEIALQQSQEQLAALKKENEEQKARLAEMEARLAEAAAKPAAPDPAADHELQAAVPEITARLERFPMGKQVGLIIDARGLRIVIPSDLAFQPSSVILADPIKPLLADLADAIAGLLPKRPLRIEGHTDNQPTVDLPFADNWGLGAARADRVRRFLIEEGKLPPERLELVTRAFYDPLGDNRTPEGRAQNRRVEIVVGFTTAF